MRVQNNPVGRPLRDACLRSRRCKLLHQGETVNAQRIYAHGERRARIVAETERLCPRIAVVLDPPLGHPRGMPRPERKRARVPSRRQRRTLGRAQCRAQNTVDERIRPPAPVFFRQLHRRIARGGRRHAIHDEDLVEAKPQEFAYGGLRLAEVCDILPDHIVERFSRLRNAVDKLRQKTAVALREHCIAKRLCKRNIGICALRMHPLQHQHRQLAHTVDFVLTIPLHYAPFSVTFSTGSMISSS